MARAQAYDALAWEQNKLANPGESRTGHFNDAAGQMEDDKHHVHNGMNDDPDIPRFGADDYDG